MKKIFNYILAVSFIISATGCEKFLDQAPDQRTELNSPQKVSELLVTAYSAGNYAQVAEAMSDNVSFVNATGNNIPANYDAYFWKDIRAINQDSPTYFWTNTYKAIAVANQALDAIAKAKDPENYKAQKGEALLARAYAHFMLAVFFSKPYDEATANTDMGIPYVTEPENVVLKNYDRKTVAYTYAQIQKDIDAGLPLINDNTYTVPAYHFTKRAAYAFASRFYMFKKDYNKVIECANLAFPANNYAENLKPWPSYASMPSSTEIGTAFTTASTPGNLLLIQTTSWLNRYYNRAVFAFSQNRLNSITAPMGISFTALRKFSFSSTYYFVPKYQEHFVRTSINASTGTAYVMHPSLTAEELLLNRAEAYIMKDQFANAITDINILLSKRITNYTSANGVTDAKIKAYYSNITDVKQMYINAVLDFRRAEFVHEGLRWMDILRHKLPVVHIFEDGSSKELKADDLRRQWQLPDEVVLSGVQQNPR
ncbi:RagB/SusD family nutrient uptake outer membrane protein [Pedobacter sp.]